MRVISIALFLRFGQQNLVEDSGHEGLSVHVHAGPGLVVLGAELLDPVGGEPCPLPLLQHVVGSVHPPVSSNLLQGRTLDGGLLEHPHEQPRALHGALLVKILELELDVEDVVLGLLGRLALEWKLAGHEDIEKNTKRPNIRLRIGLGLLNDLGSSIVKVVCSLDLSSIAGNSLCSLKVGKLDLDGSSKRSARADKDVGWFQVEVDLATPVDVFKSIQNLSCNVTDHILGVEWTLSNVGENIGGGKRVELKQRESISLESINQRYHLLMTKSLEVLEFSGSSITALSGGLVKQLDRVHLAFLVDIGSDGKASLGQLTHEVKRSRILISRLHWLLLTLIRQSPGGILDILSSLDLLEDIIELSSGGSRGWSHDNTRWDRWDGPSKLVLGKNSELVTMRWTEVVNNKVFMLDVISQVNPVNVSINVAHLDLVAEDRAVVEDSWSLPGQEDVCVSHGLNLRRVWRSRDISKDNTDRAGGLANGVASNNLVEASIRWHGRVKSQVAPTIFGVDNLQSGVIHEDEVILEPLDGSSWLAGNEAGDTERFSLHQSLVLRFLSEEWSDSINNLSGVGHLDCLTISQLGRLEHGEVLSAPGIKTSFTLGYLLLLHDISESSTLLDNGALDILELSTVGSGNTEILSQSSREVSISDLEKISVRTILVVGLILEVLNGDGWSSVFLSLNWLGFFLDWLRLFLLFWRIDHAGWMGEGSRKRSTLEHEVTGSMSDPFLQTNIIVPESLSADLVLLRDLNTWLLQDLEPRMSTSLSDTHTLLRLVDQQVGNKVLSLTRDVLPQLEVEVNVTHLDTLQGFSVILASEWRHSRQKKIGDDTTRPHVRGKGSTLSIDNLRSNILWLTILKLDN